MPSVQTDIDSAYIPCDKQFPSNTNFTADDTVLEVSTHVEIEALVYLGGRRELWWSVTINKIAYHYTVIWVT